MRDGELFNDTRVAVALSMLNRHGLIAGATGTGKTKTLQLLAGQLSKAGRPRLRRRHQGRPDRARGARRRDEPEGHRALRLDGLDVPGVRAPGRVPVAVGQARRAGPRHGPLVRAAAARARCSTSTRPRRASWRWSSSTATTTTCRCSTSRTSPRRSSSSPRTRASRSSPTTAGCRRASVGVLLRSIVVLEQEGADVFFGEPEFEVEDLLRTTPDGRGDHQHPRAVGRHGQAAPVLDVHALDARPAVREPARGRRPAQAEAVLLLRRGAPALRRRVRGADGPGRADRPAHPLQGRRRLLRHPGADRRPVAGPRPARQPRPARAARRSRPRTPTRCARPRGPSR